MPACLAGQPLPAGADPYADHAWRQRLPVNPESRQFPVGVLLSSLSEIVAWSPDIWRSEGIPWHAIHAHVRQSPNEHEGELDICVYEPEKTGQDAEDEGKTGRK